MPVSDLPPLDPIERKGSLVERLSGFSWMQEEIQKQIDMNEDFSSIKVLKLNNCLDNHLGCLKSEFTDDGIHVNAIGARKSWAEISSQF
jgi:hypothetical protein